MELWRTGGIKENGLLFRGEQMTLLEDELTNSWNKFEDFDKSER